jgi:hypothetical protein
MPTFDIYQNGEKIESKKFNRHFYILADLTGKITWKADREKGGNEILIWIQSNYRLLCVRPDWLLSLNGVQLPQKFYADPIDLTGKHVSLRYSDYEFICQFPKSD